MATIYDCPAEVTALLLEACASTGNAQCLLAFSSCSRHLRDVFNSQRLKLIRILAHSTVGYHLSTAQAYYTIQHMSSLDFPPADDKIKIKQYMTEKLDPVLRVEVKSEEGLKQMYLTHLELLEPLSESSRRGLSGTFLYTWPPIKNPNIDLYPKVKNGDIISRALSKWFTAERRLQFREATSDELARRKRLRERTKTEAQKADLQ